MLTAEQLNERATGFGGSEIGALLGINPYTTPAEVVARKIQARIQCGLVDPNTLPPETVEAVLQLPEFELGEAGQWGNLLEDPIAREWAARKGEKVRRITRTLRHPKADWLVGHIDRDIVGKRALLEVKTVTWRLAHLWGADDTDQVAEYYLPQPHAYMGILDYDVAHLAALIGGNELRSYTIERDREMDDMLLEVTGEYWHTNVLTGVLPEFTYDHKATSGFLSRMYRGTNGETVQLPEELAHWHHVMLDAKAQVKLFDAVAEGCENRIKRAMGRAAAGVIPGIEGAYKRKTITRKGYEVAPSEYTTMTFDKKGA